MFQIEEIPLVGTKCLLLQRRGRDGQFRFNQDWDLVESGKKSSVSHYHFGSADVKERVMGGTFSFSL